MRRRGDGVTAEKRQSVKKGKNVAKKNKAFY